MGPRLASGGVTAQGLRAPRTSGRIPTGADPNLFGARFNSSQELNNILALTQSTGATKPITQSQAQATGLNVNYSKGDGGSGAYSPGPFAGVPGEARLIACADFRKAWLESTSAILARQVVVTREGVTRPRQPGDVPGLNVSSPGFERFVDPTKRVNTGIDDDDLFRACELLTQEMVEPGSQSDTDLINARALMERAARFTLNPLPGILLRFTRTPPPIPT